jgi:hypothetical protein
MSPGAPLALPIRCALALLAGPLISACTGEPTLATAGSVGACVTANVSGSPICLVDTPQVGGAATATAPPSKAPVPASVDHRSYLDGCISIHSQGACSYGVAHAVTAMLEAGMCRAQSRHETLSEPHLWYLGGDAGDDCQGGWTIEDAFSTLERSTAAGSFLVPSAVWRYQPDGAAMQQTRPDWQRLIDAGRYGLLAGASYAVPPRDPAALKAALARGYDVVYGLPIFDCTGWVDSDCSSTPTLGQIQVPADASDPGRHHVVLVVGYDEAGAGSFEILNDWGFAWGVGGYGQVPAEVIAKYGQGGRYATGTVARPAEPLSDLPLHVEDYFSLADLEALRDAGLAIYFGTSPPTIEGEYAADEPVIVYDDTPGATTGETLPGFTLVLSAQGPSGVTVSVLDGATPGPDQRSLISGEGACFSVFVPAASGLGCETRPAEIVSGCLSSGDIEGLQVGVVAAAPQLGCAAPPGGRLRILVEADGLAQGVAR